jgi:hypothetical protein
VTAAPPAFPEAALRAVLAGTVAAWAAAQSAAADPPSAEDEPRRFYLDAFAGAEFQFGTGVARSGDEETRAAAAFRALESAGLASATAVFAEEDPAHLGRIYAELEDAAGGERLRATRDLPSLAPGEISLVEMPFAAVADEVARHAAGARTFAFFAPPAARSLPWAALRPLVALPDATVLVRLPHSDWEKQSRHNSPLADLPGFVRRIVEGCSAMLDDARHGWLAAWRAEASARDPAAAMAGVAERFRALLQGVAGERILKPMELEAADGARTWLFLVTPDPAVALAANAAVRAARLTDRAAAATAAIAAAPVAAPAEPAPRAPSAPAPKQDAAPAPKPDAATVSSGDASTAAEPPPSPAPGRRRGRKAAAASSPPAVIASAEVVEGSGDAEVEPPPASAPAEPEPPSLEPEAADRERKPVVAAKTADRRLKPQQPSREEPAPVAEVLDLFGEQPGPDDMAIIAPPDPSVLAAALEARFGGSTVAWRDILRAFAAADTTPNELRAALAHLRRAGRATYRSLKADADAVTFPTEPIVREKPRRERKRKSTDDGGFFGADEGGEGESGGGGEGEGDGEDRDLEGEAE